MSLKYIKFILLVTLWTGSGHASLNWQYAWVVGSHIWNAVPAKEAQWNNAFWPALAEVFIIPFVSNYIDPKDPIQMTIVRDISQISSVHFNVKGGAPFRVYYKHDGTHYVALGTKIVEKALLPHILNSTVGTDIRTGSRIALYVADTSTRFWTSLGVYNQVLDKNSPLSPVLQQISNWEYYSAENAIKALYEAPTGSLAVVALNDRILSPSQVGLQVENAVLELLAFLPGNASKSIYEQDSWQEVVGAGYKNFFKAFLAKYLIGLHCSTTALATMKTIENIPAGPVKTVAVSLLILVLLEVNHGLTTQLAETIFYASGQDD